MRHRAVCAGYARCTTPNCSCWCDHTQDRQQKPSRARRTVGVIPGGPRFYANPLHPHGMVFPAVMKSQLRSEVTEAERMTGGQPPDDDERGMTI